MATTLQIEALTRARNGTPCANDVQVIMEFAARGVPVDDIKPRLNVYTYNGWKALGKQVRRGEKSVRIVTWIPIAEKRDGAGKIIRKAGRRPKTACVFHESQVDPQGAR